MSTTDPAAASGGHIPDLHSTLIAPTGQSLPIWTPRHAIEDGIGVVGILKDLRTSSRGRIPEPKSIVPPSASQEQPIRTPFDPLHGPAMSMQRPGQRLCGHIPERHQHIGSYTGQSFPIRTPRHIVESDSVALDDAHALSALDVPHSQGPIFTATEQAAAVGRESDAIHRSGMPLQPRSITALLRIPEPNRVVKATAGHRAPIWAPGHRIHSALGSDRLDVCTGLRIPEPDGRIFPATGEYLAIGGKGQIFDDVGMPSWPKQCATLYIP